MDYDHLVELAAELPAVQADVTQLQQVIMNLVINASDAIGEQSGSITLRTGIKRVEAGQCEQTYTGELLNEGEYVFLEVCDTGCGMNAETRKKLFDPFYSTKFTGRGLGMSAVLGIVRGHHGAIIVESEPGQGSCFRVLLPVFSGAVGAGLAEEDEAVDWCPTGTVLVVDDEEVVRETAAMMLEDIGFQTLAAVDGVDALKIYREHSDEIALVLLDMTMPRMDGHRCFEQLRIINPQVRVVLSSGYNEKNVTHVFADNELAGFVQKPYRLATLRAKLREALEL
ncbi:MAG: response regulator [Mariprofundaceae bacterium]|nr:response regulator [Mariprofundaceae bacterium]